MLAAWGCDYLQGALIGRATIEQAVARTRRRCAPPAIPRLNRN